MPALSVSVSLSLLLSVIPSHWEDIVSCIRFLRGFVSLLVAISIFVYIISPLNIITHTYVQVYRQFIDHARVPYRKQRTTIKTCVYYIVCTHGGARQADECKLEPHCLRTTTVAVARARASYSR